MTSARREVFDPDESGFYHCISRCVRRAYLCGFDRYSMRSYEHRKEWVRGRLSELLDIFSIGCVSYAIMSNHLHLLIRTYPIQAKAWSPEEVAVRWRTLFPKRRARDGSPEPATQTEIEEIINDPNLVTKYRQRLSDISWFNRCLNESIARQANREDRCTGRFWEGRFKCQKVQGFGAILACSVYVDLNPVRAGIAATPEASDFTSIQDRIRAVNQPEVCAMGNPKLVVHKETFGMSEESYITLVDETGRMLKSGKRNISAELEPVLQRLKLNPKGWMLNAKSQSQLFRRVIAPLDTLKRLARKNNKAWFQGMASARLIFT